MGNVINHPAAALMPEVDAEKAITSTPEARALQEAICQAMRAYCAYLVRGGWVWDEEREIVQASDLHVICDLGGYYVEITLKDGLIDRRYGTGVNPNPDPWPAPGYK